MDMVKMRSIAFLSLLISGILVMSSCEKPIYDNVQTTETDIIVEGWKVVDMEVSFD